MKYSNFLGSAGRLLVISSFFLTSGCLATQEWVQTWTNEQLFPMNKRISDTEANVTQMGGKVDTMAKQIADLEGRLNQTNAKADRALDNLQRLRPERKMVLNFSGDAQFATNSIEFSGQAKRDIDSFVSDLKGQADEGNLVLVIAGHTDNVGGERSNYELSQRRAQSIAAYLTAQKKFDPSRLLVVGYGESTPVADNKTEAGRAKNRRVEILVYRDSIAVGSAAVDPRAGVKTQR